MDDNDTIRVCRGRLRLLFAVDPKVGEDFAAANAETLGRVVQSPPKPLLLKLFTSSGRLGEIDLTDTQGGAIAAGAAKLTDQVQAGIRALGDGVPQDLRGSVAFLIDPDHRRRVTAPVRAMARDGILALVSSGNRGDTRAELEKINNAAAWAEQAHADLQITGRAASWYIGYAALMVEVGNLSPAEFEAEIAPLFFRADAKQTTMLAWLAQKLCEFQAGDRVAYAADACLAKGMAKMSLAYKANDLEQFHNRIFGALPHILAAFLLAGITDKASPAHARSSRSAEATILRALHTLQNAIADHHGLANLRGYQSAIAAIRQREGAGEAKRMALELTDMLMLYPAICKPILVGDVRL